MKVLEKVRGKRSQSLIHIWNEAEEDFLIGLCNIWINDDNWEIRERDDDDLEGLCSRCLAKLERIRNPPPPSPPKKVRISKKARERNEREAKRKTEEEKKKAEEEKLREWNELCLGKGKKEGTVEWREDEF